MDGRIGLVVPTLACGGLLIRVGLGWYATGMSRAKNAAGAVLRNVVDLAVATVAFWAVGMAIQNSSAGMLFDAKNQATDTQFVQLLLVLIASAPVAGAIAERCRFFPALISPVLLAGVIVPLGACFAWGNGGQGGWLQRMGYFDAAGAGVIHVMGGAAALVAAIVVGPRTGKYNRDGSSNLIPGHSVPMASVGVLLMLAGWIPYVLAAASLHGGISGRTSLNVMLAGASATLVAVFISNARYGKPDVMLAYSGLLGGLVAISASAGAVPTIGAVAIGAVAGVIVPTMTVMLDLVWKIDDPAGGVAIHLIGGAWGVIAVGFFAPSRGWGDWARQVGVQALGLVVLAAIAFVAAIALFIALRKTIGLRLKEEAEYDGADLAEHDLNAYPDFQQTMIKSYHLREA